MLPHCNGFVVMCCRFLIYSFRSIVLHPGLKLEYFCNQDWEQEWIDAAESLTREEYKESYENEDQLADMESEARVGPFLLSSSQCC